MSRSPFDLTMSRRHVEGVLEITGGADCPPQIVTFLSARGWGNLNNEVFAHGAKGFNGMSWEQALAIEFYEFITIGGSAP